jgi:hypothetical protein
MWHPGHRCHICHIGFIEAHVASKARSRNTTYQGESNIRDANTCSGVRIAGIGAYPVPGKVYPLRRKGLQDHDGFADDG